MMCKSKLHRLSVIIALLMAVPCVAVGQTDSTDRTVADNSALVTDAVDVESVSAVPTAHAMPQPTGPLTGVTLFIGAGHGWTADTNGTSVAENPVKPIPAWCQQRPVLLGMTEDQGNLAQMNFMVHYAFNAGATVVPLRPAGYQPIEVVLDNDDPGVTFTGTWMDTNGPSAEKYYENRTTISGIPYKYTQASIGAETATAKYSPNITVTDFYPVYCFTKAGPDRTKQTYRVKHSGGLSSVTIDHRLVGNGWIWLGQYYFEAGDENYVEISNESSESGVIVADAIRWGCGMGDVARPVGTNGVYQISGYPRYEECQRYWAHSEMGNNAVGFSDDIWDARSADGSDNVVAGARIAREMNQKPLCVPNPVTDRWKRIHLEFHTNAGAGTNRGSLALITSADSGHTMYQVEYANMLSEEVDRDLLLVDDEFEHQWVDRSASTYTSDYGAISQANNSDEFDATILESGFHDNQEDAELLRDSHVRMAIARASLHGIIKFLHSLPGSEVTLDFAPDTPRNFQVEDLGDGEVVLSWIAPLSDEARGDPATGYVVYSSDNGYGFGNPVSTTGLSLTVSGVPAGETRYYRVAATNAGGESMPTEVLAVRRSGAETPKILIVNGFDGMRRWQNVVETYTHPEGYAGQSVERLIHNKINSFDYVVQFGTALVDANAAYGFDSCSNEAVVDGSVVLDEYDIVLWILGTESTLDETLGTQERNKLQDYLDLGRGLFISGADLAFDLNSHGGTALTFLNDRLQSDLVADNANTTGISGSGGILNDIGSFDFDFSHGAPYEVRYPDSLSVEPGGEAVLLYDGSGAVAGVQYDFCVWRAVTFGFPFEAITSAEVRADIMGRVIPFLADVVGPTPFDYYKGNYQFGPDCDVDNDDLFFFTYCVNGPDYTYPNGNICSPMDGNGDGTVDLNDFALFQAVYTGPVAGN